MIEGLYRAQSHLTTYVIDEVIRFVWANPLVLLPFAIALVVRWREQRRRRKPPLVH